MPFAFCLLPFSAIRVFTTQIQTLYTTMQDKTNSLEPSLDNSQTPDKSLTTLLPRTAWTSNLAYWRVLLKAKIALDKIEKEAANKGNREQGTGKRAL
ncbi:hypothetical protein [Moorena sp. SIO4G3]|uniref:hypothetical protein n=1 Tax=Moorena sp. SIO4G3 TaxID=2607821 RepID=UPI00142C00E6|nr:hypothetical protein [Moorena sp. SIO4G3]NEO82407.1 hypothetical protein [Moorena sp. SIO4G3]